MDRRRRLQFVPAPENLEGRQLLASGTSMFGAAAPPVSTTVTQLSTLQERNQRIERLPAFLASLEPGRSLPEPLMREIQADLMALKGRLHPAPSAGLNDFNRQLRGLISHGSVRAEVAGQLNNSFRKNLLAAGAPTEVAENLAANLNTLTQISTQTSSFPTTLVSNDYAAVLQVALGVGRPLRAPGAPRLAPADDTGKPGDHVTSVAQPSLVGQYDPGTSVHVIDESGQDLGSAPVDSKGRVTVRLDRPLSEGTHTLYFQGVDPDGAAGLLSPRFTLRIVPAVPAGPLAARS